MATPTQHRTTAEQLLADKVADPGFTPEANDVDWLLVFTHAALSSAAGTGTDYASAETALAAVAADDGAWHGGRLAAARAAYAHALLADPA